MCVVQIILHFPEKIKIGIKFNPMHMNDSLKQEINHGGIFLSVPFACGAEMMKLILSGKKRFRGRFL